MTTTRILAIALPVWLAAAGILLYLLFRPAMRVAAVRGEVAEHPDEMDEACALTQLPTRHPVRVVSRESPTTPRERRFAKDIENWMKEQVR